MRIIKMANNLSALVDDQDYLIITSHPFAWCASYKHNNVYARSTIIVGNRRLKISMHRMILGLNDRSVIVDHIDGNGLNNQRYNLRICTPSQNQQNRKFVCGQSKFKGVTKTRNGQRWKASILINHKRVRIGSFISEVDAAKAYDLVAKQHFGEFAKLNFPDIDEQVMYRRTTRWT